MPAASGDLGQRRVLEVREACAVLIRKEEIPQTTRPGLDLEFLEHRYPSPGPRVLQGLELFFKNGLGGVDLLVHEDLQLLAQPLGRRVVGKVHQLCSFIDVRPAAIKGSTIAPTVSNPAPTVWPWM